MNASFSVYLDLVRFTAACLVYLYHSNQRLISASIVPASGYGHSSVIVFFVLSGFVIAHVTQTKEREWISYSASRASRIYSVAVPAVVLTIVLDALGRSMYPALYGYPFDYFFLRSAASLLLLNEWWFVSITPFSNVPYWSICYEGWYYVAFGIATFAPRRSAWMPVAALGLLLGPKIVLLAPIWCLGVALYRWKALGSLSPRNSWLLAIVSLAGIVMFHHGNVAGILGEQLRTWIGPEWQKELTFSKDFLSDYLLGILVFCNFAGMRGAAPTLSALMKVIERPIRFLAGFTLTLYLLHQPLLLFWGAVIRGDPTGSGFWWQVTLMTALSVMLIGHFTESKRQVFKAWIVTYLRRINAAWAAKRYVAGG